MAAMGSGESVADHIRAVLYMRCNAYGIAPYLLARRHRGLLTHRLFRFRILKVIQVDTLDLDGSGDPDANAEPNHQSCQFLAVDQYHADVANLGRRQV
jgi:hypothetical protein